ncbi:conjugative transposon protein TraM [Alistipes onderdonkii]|uniref:Conjugative transposon protein TraM n=1 Tax=Alistipes onderdonkii TaxID=328813 RepID=A0A9P3ZHB1_9BACT|nr:conjugative transposon protein TraM [Alistipes onderdonkii]MTT00543.1 conjugative transposon protein TraM [Proteus mirabilis]NAD41358.1 conjugative transposon protein TraM [Escherichia coli]KAA2409181.1 conjugative transposon protein TraM [Alistipes onderdonkii]KAA2415941.1 conjugative transposon protein TraM [Alistipes onderdonkii]
MTENKNPCSDPSAEFERQRKRKVLLFTAILGCIFLVVLWFIFRPAPVKPQEGAAGINTSVPDGKAQATVGDKRKAAEQLRSEEQQQKRMMTLGDNSFSLLDDGLKPSEEPAPADDPALRAAEANRAMQRQVQGFYAAPQRNAEVEALKEQVAALQSQLDAERQQPDPLELAEEQYKLARKYLGGGTAVGEEAVEQAKQRKDSRLSVMRPVREGEVEASTLDTRADFTVERNLGFLTAAGGVAHADTPTVRACVASTQVIRAGSTVQLRLLEAVRIDGVTIPRNTPLYSLATISGMRLQVTVSSVEYGGRIFAVEAVAYDMDGQPGLNIPNSRERTALKEALASVGQTAGTSVNVTRSAGQQVLSELARGGLQASSQYVAGKLREVKITLKANHQLLLISKE